MSAALCRALLILLCPAPQAETEVPLSKLGCDPDRREQGKCRSTYECTCDPIAGLRVQGRSELEDGRIKKLSYLDPASFVDYWSKFGADSDSQHLGSDVWKEYEEFGWVGVPRQERTVWREFWTPKDTLYIEESSKGFLDAEAYSKRMVMGLMWRLATSMHYVFDIRVESRNTVRKPSIRGGYSVTRVHFQLLYGYDWYVRGPGTRFEYHVVYSNMPMWKCGDGSGIQTLGKRDRPHPYTHVYQSCDGHYDDPWEQSAKFSVFDMHQKNRDPKTCGACATAYSAHAKSEYFTQWDLSLGIAGEEPAPTGEVPTLELEVDWEELAKTVMKAVFKKLPGGETAVDIGETLADIIEIKIGAGSGADYLAVLSAPTTHTDLDGAGSNSSYTLKPVASPERTSSKSTARDMKGTDMPQNGRHWTAPENQTDESGAPMAGEYVRWETPPRDGPFWNYTQIADAIPVAPDIQNSGRSYGKGDFYIGSIPCLEVVHPCDCSERDVPPETHLKPPRESADEIRVETVPRDTYEQIEGLSEESLGATAAIVIIDPSKPVTIELPGTESAGAGEQADPFGWWEGVVLVAVEDDAPRGDKPPVRTGRGDDSRTPETDEEGRIYLTFDPIELPRLSFATRSMALDDPRWYNLEFQPAQPEDEGAKKSLRLRDPSDPTGRKPLRLQTRPDPAAVDRFETMSVVLETADPSAAPYTLRHVKDGPIADYSPEIIVRQDRVTNIGRFDNMTAAQRAILAQADPQDLELVDRRGRATPLPQIAPETIETGQARPELKTPGVVTPSQPVDIDVFSDFQHASRVSGFPAAMIVTDVYRDGTELLLRTRKSSDTVSTEVRSGEKRIPVSARYTVDWDRFDAVRTDVRDRIERLDPGLSAATRETAKSMWERYEEALKRRKR